MKARLPQGYGKKGANDIQALARQAQKIQEDMDTATKELEQKEYSVTSGGGAIEVTMTGKLEIKSLKIDKEVVDPDDIEMLSDMIIAAVNESIRNVNDEKEKVMEELSGGLNLPGLF